MCSLNRIAPGLRRRERRFSRFDRQATQIVTVKLHEIEGIEQA
jgi:hypothetical protein